MRRSAGATHRFAVPADVAAHLGQICRATDTTLFTILVIMALVSTAMAAPMTRRLVRRDGGNVVDGGFLTHSQDERSAAA